MKEKDLDLLLEGIRNQDEKVLTRIYREFYPYVETFVIKNRGSRQEAKDIFQDAIVLVYKKIREDTFHVHTSLKNYLYGMCKLLWLKQLELRQNPGAKLINNEDDYPLAEEEELVENEKMLLFQHHFHRLEEDCQRVLRLYNDKASLKEIAEIMGYRNEKYAKKKKFRCKERLLEMIRNDPRFRKLSGS